MISPTSIAADAWLSFKVRSNKGSQILHMLVLLDSDGGLGVGGGKSDPLTFIYLRVT